MGKPLTCIEKEHQQAAEDNPGTDPIGSSVFALIYTLQRNNTENSKQIFQEKELPGHSPNFHINVIVSDLYITMIDLPFLLQENR